MFMAFLLLGSLEKYTWDHPLMYALPLMLGFTDRMLSLAQASNSVAVAFDAGLFLVLASWLHPAVLSFWPVFFVALIYFGAFAWRECLLFLFGLLVPTMWLGLYYYSEHGSLAALSAALSFDQVAIADAGLSRSSIPVLLVVGFTLVTGAGSFLQLIRVNKMKTKKGFYILVWSLLASVVSGWLLGQLVHGMLLLGIMALAVYFAGYFLNNRRHWLPELLFACWLISLVYLHALSG